MPDPEPSPLAELERFVADNDELLILEESIGRFNIFDALGIARVEIRHSNFLAWLLDPAESHGQSDLFLKAILMDLLRQCPAELRPLSPVELDGVELSNVVVRREWPSKTDLCVSCTGPPFVLAIENKVDSGEHSDQLTRYSAAVSAQFPGVRVLKVFLTRLGDEPTDSSWVTYTYADIHRVLDRVRRMAGGSLGPDVAVFLGHYLNLVGSQFMDNPEIIKLCHRIYANHKRAIELIVAHAPLTGSSAISPLIEWLRDRPAEWLIRSQIQGYFTFVPKRWVGTISTPEGSALPSAPCEMYLEAQTWGDEQPRVAARLVVGPGADRGKRLRVIEELTSKEIGLSMQRKIPSDKLTRLASKTLAVWGADAEVPTEKLAQEFVNWLRGIDSVLDHVPSVLQLVARGP